MNEFEIAVKVRIFLKTLESIFIQCEIDYDNVCINQNNIVIEKENKKLTYSIEEDKRVILSDALKMCWSN